MLRIMMATALVLAWIGSASATPVVYNNKAAFINETGSISATGPLPALPLSENSTTARTVGSIGFSSPAGMWFGAEGVVESDWTLRLEGADLAINGLEKLFLDLASPVSAFGFDFVEPENDLNINLTCAPTFIHL